MLHTTLEKHELHFFFNSVEANSPFSHVLGRVALLSELVVDQAQLAALLPRGDPVQADEELGAVVGIRVLGVGVVLAELVRGSLLRALESAGCL